VVGASTIRTVANPGIALHIPADGRLDGNGFAADITGYRFAYQLGYGSSAKDAAAGQALLVFGLSGTGEDLTANLEVDGQGAPLPNAITPNSSTPAYFVASVPQRAQDVALQVSANGFSQTFSFTKGHREGVQPAVLYRGQDQWEQVDNIGQVSYVNTPDKPDGVLYNRVEFTLTSATLTYFLPSTGATPASSSKAWVVLSGSALPNNDAPGVADGLDNTALNYLKTLPSSDLTLTISGQAPMPAMLSGQGGADDETGQNGGWGLFGGDYYWQVPAGLVSATLKLNLPAQLMAEAQDGGSPLEVPMDGQVPAVHVAFAPPAALAPVASSDPPAWDANPASNHPVTAGRAGSPQTGHNTASGPVGGRSGGGSSSSGLVLLVVVALVAVVGVAFLTRRRLLPLLTGLTASPAEKRAAGVRAFLPSPAPSGPKTPVAETASVPEPPASTATTSSQETRAASSARPPNESQTPAVPVLVPVPDAPAQLPEDVVWLLVLGPPTLSGGPSTRATKDELLRSELETACFLACNPVSSFSGEALRAVIGAGRDEDWSVRTIVTYVSGLRRKLGSQHVPDATGAGGYRLDRVSTDAARFKELVAVAKAEQAEGQARHLADALSLVRGAPFAGVSKGTYGWVFRTDNGPSLADDLCKIVVNAARVLARLALDANDYALATWATATGVLVWQTDLKLSMMQLDAAAICPDSTELGRKWSDISQRFAGNNEPVPDELIDYYRTLRNL
jgi:hypothetical protein